jgi:dTDP-4-amino-4,6-dideoxygalactose transaminase
VAVTNDLAVANRMRLLRSHGITRNTDEMSMEVPEPWYYEQIELGFNYRITELQAALGISQMLRLSEFLKRRREIVRRYLVGLDGTPLILPTETNGSASAWHLFVVRLRSDQKDTRDSLFKKLRADGIGVNVHYIPIYRQPYYQKFGAKIEYFPNAETYFKSAISLPLYPELSKTDQDYVIEKLQGYLS